MDLDNSMQDYKNAMSRVPTSVGVVWTLNANNQIVGCTISSFMSVSIDRNEQVVAFILKTSSRTAAILETQDDFQVSILNEDQVLLARTFASDDRFVENNLEIFSQDNWRHDCVCEFKIKARQKFVIGGSQLLIADVLSYFYNPTKKPLVYSARSFSKILRSPVLN
jgi:flavin reductase (DIM6/NTAB) family NADH-FMN oxidoreductase RutF